MKEITTVVNDENKDMYEQMESLLFQVQMAKQNYPSAFAELALSMWIQFKTPWEDSKLKKAEVKQLFFAKLEVDKINMIIKNT